MLRAKRTGKAEGKLDVSEPSEGEGRKSSGPQNHRTVDRVTQIIEEVVYHPGMTFAELARALGAPKSSVYGFMQGLLAKGWLYEQDRRFYLGPAVYGLTLASGHMRAGLVTHEELSELHEECGVPVFLQVQAGDHIISIGEAGSDAIRDFEARSNVRRTMLATAAGKVLLAMRPRAEIEQFLRTRGPEEREQVEGFLNDYEEIRRSGTATNLRLSGSRFAIARAVRNRSGEAVAAVTVVGRTQDLMPRAKELEEVLRRHTESWPGKAVGAPREAI
jgi:DNA-binding IclR family transcriptional regulator